MSQIQQKAPFWIVYGVLVKLLSSKFAFKTTSKYYFYYDYYDT